VLSGTAEPEEILKYAQQLQQECATNGMFAFPPMIDTKVDQPEVELVIDRDKVAALGLDMADGRFGFGRAGRRQLREPLRPCRPQLQGHPAARTRRAPERRQLENTYVKGPGGSSFPSAPSRTLEKHTTPRALNRFQQLNSVTISGVAIVPLETALKFLEGECARILPSGYKLDYTGDSRPVAHGRRQISVRPSRSPSC
jgi:multidrug efflux pump